jgi:hypothetical protein
LVIFTQSGLYLYWLLKSYKIETGKKIGLITHCIVRLTLLYLAWFITSPIYAVYQ